MTVRLNRQQTRLFRDLIAKLEPGLRAAFEAAVQDMRDGIDARAMLRALENGDIDAAVDAMNIEPQSFYRFLVIKTAAYSEGGAVASTTINVSGVGAVGFRFDMSNPRAERWIDENVAQSVVKMAAEGRENIRRAISEGYREGQHPDTIARDIGGRMVGSRRHGGIVGLSAPQEEYVRSFRNRLRSGDPDQMRKVLGMTRRDHRSDKVIERAIRDGKKIPEADIQRMADRYTDRLIASRAAAIARTETATAVMAARVEEWRQAAEKLGYDATAVIKTWRHGGGVMDPRPHHVSANGSQVQGLDTPFILSNGASLLHSHDAAAGAGEVVNCSCDTTFRFSHTAGLT